MSFLENDLYEDGCKIMKDDYEKSKKAEPIVLDEEPRLTEEEIYQEYAQYIDEIETDGAKPMWPTDSLLPYSGLLN